MLTMLIPDIDAPIQTSGSTGGAAEPSDDQITMLSEMGFTAAQARKALRESVSCRHVRTY